MRAAPSGDVAFDFESAKAAKDWNTAIKEVGPIYPANPQQADLDRTVYLGRVPKQ